MFLLAGEGGRYLLCWVPWKELTSITGPVISYSEFRTMDKVNKPSDSEHELFKVGSRDRI
jgi:hypothetical protein